MNFVQISNEMLCSDIDSKYLIEIMSSSFDSFHNKRNKINSFFRSHKKVMVVILSFCVLPASFQIEMKIKRNQTIRSFFGSFFLSYTNDESYIELMLIMPLWQHYPSINWLAASYERNWSISDTINTYYICNMYKNNALRLPKTCYFVIQKCYVCDLNQINSINR